MIELPKRRSLKLLGGGAAALAAGVTGMGGLLLPKSARATQTSYAVITTTTTPTSFGGVSSASSQWSGTFPISSINNGERIGIGGALWKDTTPDAYPDWVQIDFNNNKKINRVVVYTTQDGPTYSEPTDTMTFSQYGITDFSVQYWNGGSWITVGSVSGNNLVKRTFTFAPVITTKIRVNITNAHQYSRVVEVEAWTVPPDTYTASYNAALAAPPPLVSGHNYSYATLAKAQTAKQNALNCQAALAAKYQQRNAPMPQTDFSIVTKSVGASDPSQYNAFVGPQMEVVFAPGVDPAQALMRIQSEPDPQTLLNTVVVAAIDSGLTFLGDAIASGIFGATALAGASGLAETGVIGAALGGAMYGTWLYNTEFAIPHDALNQPPDLSPKPVDPDAPWAYSSPISSFDSAGTPTVGCWGSSIDGLGPINQSV